MTSELKCPSCLAEDGESDEYDRETLDDHHLAIHGMGLTDEKLDEIEETGGVLNGAKEDVVEVKREDLDADAADVAERVDGVTEIAAFCILDDLTHGEIEEPDEGEDDSTPPVKSENSDEYDIEFEDLTLPRQEMFREILQDPEASQDEIAQRVGWGSQSTVATTFYSLGLDWSNREEAAEAIVETEGDCAHKFETVSVEIESRSSPEPFVVERCEKCGDLRVDETIEVVEVVEG